MNKFNELISWSKDSYAHLPWRKRRSLYHTLVSEIMLQQTTVGTVLNHFERFIELYPDVETLAKSTDDEVCIAWKGLGYYRRARNLRKAAIDICEHFDGEIPLSYEDLTSIKGIGEYTANAILSIGEDKKALAVDANLERVLSRIFGIKEKKGLKLQNKLKSKFVNGELAFGRIKSYRELNESLMDLGRVLCQARKTDCAICPLRTICIANKSNDPLAYPETPQAKVKKYHQLELLRAVVIRGNKVLGYEKSQDEWLSGQVELPTFVVKTDDRNFKGYPKWENDFNSDVSIKTSITKYKILNHIQEFEKKELPNNSAYKYYELDPLKVNFATATLKVLKKINVIK